MPIRVKYPEEKDNSLFSFIFENKKRLTDDYPAKVYQCLLIKENLDIIISTRSEG